MKFKATSAFYLGEELIPAGTVLEIEEVRLKRCLAAKVGFVIEEGGENGTKDDNTSGTGTGNAGGGKAPTKGGRK